MLLLDSLNDLRINIPGIKRELYHELAGKDEGKQKIAIRFPSKSTIDGEDIDFSVAAFGIVDDDKLIEWRQVADLETLDLHGAAAHRPPIAPT